MTGYVIYYDLRPGPREKLPAAFGLLDAAEERGLSRSVWQAGVWRRLPEGVLWGRFADSSAAIAAFDQALDDASELLGFCVRAERRLAASLPV